MLKRIVAGGWVLTLFLGAPLLQELGVSGLSVHAQEEEEERETRRVPSISEATYKKLSEAQEAIDAEDLTTARQVLNEMLERRSRLNGNEIGQVYNMLGFVHFSQENYPEAIRAYEQVLAQGEDVQAGLEVSTLYTLAQLSFVEERYNDALRYMETWIGKANNPGAEPHIFMGQVYYQMEDYPAAITQIELGIDVARERDVAIKENWWALLNFLYFEQENWPRVLEILEIMVRDFPKREYWIRLAGIHGQQGNDEESLWTYEAADVGGFLTRQGDITNYAGLLMQAEVPFRAARALERGLEEGIVERTDSTLQSLGQAWQLSQEVEKAIPVLQEAARLSDEGRIFERLAQVLLDNDQFDECVTAANRALDKGGLRQESGMYTVRGMCQHNLENMSAARESFVACRNTARREDDESGRRICQQWITYIDNEERRSEQLRRAGI
ncbi:MAG: tetratricopeptide repeat protein [Gammaproteobacteria bacterium]|nr:tetratricopeptide repeat protein [Gammaproteobacteria bacterium]